MTRASAFLVILFALSAIALGAGLWSLTRGRDLLALALCLLGAALLRTLFRASKLAEGGGS